MLYLMSPLLQLRKWKFSCIVSIKTPGLKEVCVPVLVVEIKVRGRVAEVIRCSNLSLFDGPVFSLCDS